MQKRDFKGVWIPKEIWLSTDLKVMEKLILVEIDSLDNEDGCFASNEHFSKFFSLSKNRCSEIIKSLEKKGYIKIDYIYQEGSKAISRRVIRCVRNIDGGIRNIDNPIRKTEEGYSENREDNNTSFNISLDNALVTKFPLFIISSIIFHLGWDFCATIFINAASVDKCIYLSLFKETSLSH